VPIGLNRTLQKEPKGPGGSPPFDYLMTFKILILQRLYNISDAQGEYQINDLEASLGVSNHLKILMN
jgi:hypothetical protein